MPSGRIHGGLDVGEAKRALENQQNGKRAENEKDVERNAVAPPRPLKQDDDGEQDDRALGEPLEEDL